MTDLSSLQSDVIARIEAADSEAADNVRKVAAIISSCPEVSHNFRRDHYYTLWFTISAENDERVGQGPGRDP